MAGDNIEFDHTHFTIYIINWLRGNNYDPIKFADPVCIKLDFKTHNIGIFNNDEGLQDANEEKVRQATRGLSFYNILTDCKHPIASHQGE